MARKPALAFIFITLLLDFLGIGLIAPVLPKLVVGLREAGEAEGARAFGFMVSTYAMMQFLFAPLLGSLSDRFGRRRVILVALLGSGLDYFLLAWAPTLAWLFVGRVISGITGANYAPAMAYIADVSAPEKRAANFGLMGVAFGIGFTLGPALGGMLGSFHPRLPFWVAGGLTLANWAYGMLVLPESLPRAKRRRFSWSKSNPIGALLDLRRYPMVLGLSGTFFLIHVAHQVFPSTWVLFTEHRFQWNESKVGWSLALVGVMAAVVQGGLSRRLIPRWGERYSALFGMSVGAFALLLYGVVAREWALYVIIFFGSLGGLAAPAIQGFASRTVGDDEQGGLQGTLTSLSSVAGIVGPPLATSMFAWGIDRGSGAEVAGAAFFLAAGLQVIAITLALLSFRRRRALLQANQSDGVQADS